MRILILGATGPSGILLIRETLATYKQCAVIIYARSPEKLPEDLSSNESLVIIKGTLTDADALERAVEGVDVVLSALGPLANHPAGTPLAKGYELLIDLMKKQGVKRIVLLGTASIHDPNDKFSVVYRALILGVATLAPKAYADIVAVGEVFRTQGDDLDWTIARVPVLTNGESRETVVGYVGDGKVGTRLSRKGFAAFVLGEVEKREWVKQRPLLSSI
ncbi:hypothetical protein D9611_003460 [Ephemerocybe angulata]|uniref:Uncharacterized protein n=2 Tax=Ephemerocybe angulata TaxID=980116 RepID=A0A8H5FHE5_9AGAR|nr:hypothetical protein D9611_003460 [Tulosesus angulatus]KAF6766491.1 NAD-P-binding protein [Tulosesus angulatus]